MASDRKSFIVPGFRFSGISSGIKKGRKKDIALIFSERSAAVAGVFTTNTVKAAPVIQNIRRLRRSKRGQAFIVNSGNANACTGNQGMKDADETARRIARELGISHSLVYVSSTGVIGQTLPMVKIRRAIRGAVENLSPGGLPEAAAAIMTTDMFPKIASKKLSLGGKTGTISGIAKGAGMICPNMATMLSFIVTDIAVDPSALDSALKDAVRRSFNRLTVDNDMSTNDTVLIMANGHLGNKPFRKNSPFYSRFYKALFEVTYHLSREIVRDGEGATKLIKVLVRRARTEQDAEKVARAVAGSLLVKTAVYGKSPNWGRVMAAIGSSGVKVREDKVCISFNSVQLVKNGVAARPHSNARNIFSGHEVSITVDLGLGRSEAEVLTCDLTEKYVKINAEYLS
jgi:glutamate N-acetyltransferase/amino-acid N-acetyltransferase